MGIIRKHCPGNLTVCDFANLCGLGKAGLWIFSLLPQLILNWKRKSVEGLSVLWATAIFTASFVHSFYVFDKDKYIFFKITLILVPVMKFALLVQFWVYSRHNSVLKFSFAAGCLVFYGAVLTLELSVPRNSAAKLEWMAVVFFSVERVPQIVLNLMNRSTFGQATPSVILSAVEETLGFLYYYLLIFESQFQFMQFFSVSFGYINFMQILWYPVPVKEKKKKTTREYGATKGEEGAFAAEENVSDAPPTESKEQTSQLTLEFEEPQAILTSYVMPPTPGVMDRLKGMRKGNLFLFFCLLTGLVSFTAILYIKHLSLWALLAPLSVLISLSSAAVYRSYREGTLPCQEPPYPQVHYRSFKG